jgi:hypothetical protein
MPSRLYFNDVKLMSPASKIWFPAKRYGTGWSWPRCWQGWLVLIGYFVLVGVGARFLSGGKPPVYFRAYFIALTIGLVVICAWKGESKTEALRRAMNSDR